MPATETIPDIRDIAPPMEVAEPLPLWVYAAGLGALIAIVFLVRWLVRKKPIPLHFEPAKEPRERALDILHELKRDYASIPPDAFAERAVEALRVILSSRFGHASRTLTPDEFFARHGEEIDRHFDPERQQQLAELLSVCDRLRFAPEPHNHSERLPLAEAAIAFVRNLPEKAAATPETAPENEPETDVDPIAV